MKFRSRLWILLLFPVITFCSEDTQGPETGSPVITSFAPVLGLPGSEVLIKGSGFTVTPANNRVSFNGKPATVTEASDTTLRVVVPELATSGKITVKVNRQAVDSETAYEVLKNIPVRGLVGFWPFTGDGKESALNSAVEIDLNRIATLPALTTDRFGHANQAIHFNGAQDTFGEISLDNYPWTISVWLKPEQLNDPVIGLLGWFNGNRHLEATLENTAGGNYFIRVTGQNGEEAVNVPGIEYDLVAGSPEQRYIAAGVSETEWMNITMTYDGAVFRIYVDNAVIYTNTIVVDTPTTQFLTLGRIYPYTFYTGSMDDLAVYDIALIPEEITQLYGQTVSKY